MRMIWPKDLLGQIDDHDPPQGYQLRLYQKGDEESFFNVMAHSGWERWNQDALDPWLAKIIPDSWFMIIHKKSKNIVCTAMGLHNYKGIYPFWGELGWLASDPEHSGQGLGLVVSAAVTERLMEAGYKNIQLFTEDFRLPAIKTYLKLGFIPSIIEEGQIDRWRNIFTSLDWPNQPGIWATMKDA